MEINAAYVGQLVVVGVVGFGDVAALGGSRVLRGLDGLQVGGGKDVGATFPDGKDER